MPYSVTDLDLPRNIHPFKHCYIMYSRAMEWTYCYSSSCGEVHQLSKLIFSEGKYMWIYTNKPGEHNA